MPRPRMRRRICFDPEVTFYKPQGVPLRDLKVVELELDEVEALRLKNVEGLNQDEGARRMKVSQSTFQRILKVASEKMVKAIVGGMAIKINKAD